LTYIYIYVIRGHVRVVKCFNLFHLTEENGDAAYWQVPPMVMQQVNEDSEGAESLEAGAPKGGVLISEPTDEVVAAFESVHLEQVNVGAIPTARTEPLNLDLAAGLEHGQISSPVVVTVELQSATEDDRSSNTACMPVPPMATQQSSVGADFCAEPADAADIIEVQDTGTDIFQSSAQVAAVDKSAEAVVVVSPIAEDVPLLSPQKNEKDIRFAEGMNPQPDKPVHDGQNRNKAEINKSKNAYLRRNNRALTKSDEHTLKKTTRMAKIRNLEAPGNKSFVSFSNSRISSNLDKVGISLGGDDNIVIASTVAIKT
jgi:hypothetical protein